MIGSPTGIRSIVAHNSAQYALLRWVAELVVLQMLLVDEMVALPHSDAARFTAQVRLKLVGRGRGRKRVLSVCFDTARPARRQVHAGVV